MTQSDDTSDYFLNYMRYYNKFADPIVYEIKDIPLVAEPAKMQYYEDSLIV